MRLVLSLTPAGLGSPPLLIWPFARPQSDELQRAAPPLYFSSRAWQIAISNTLSPTDGGVMAKVATARRLTPSVVLDSAESAKSVLRALDSGGAHAKELVHTKIVKFHPLRNHAVRTRGGGGTQIRL